MRPIRLILAATAVILASFAVFAKYPAATRGVYYNGLVHYVSVQDGNPPTVAHWAWVPNPSDWSYSWSAHPTATLALDKDSKWLDPNGNDHGQGVCVFNGILHHVAVLTDAQKAPHLYLTRYDLTQNKFLDYRKLQATTYPSGSVQGGGVAAAVLDSTIFVFADSFTLSSADGINWTKLDGLVDGYIPMDAAPFYPQNAPGQIALVYKRFDKGDGVYALSWGGPSGGTPENFTISSGVNARCAALIAGTEKPAYGGAGTYNSTGSKDSPCLQMFFLQEASSGHTSYAIHRAEFEANSGTWTLDPKHYSTNDIKCPIDRIRISPWYDLALGQDGREVQKQSISLSLYECTAEACLFHDYQFWAFTSDFMVAQNEDPAQGGYGWAGLPTVTTAGTDPDVDTLRRYWTLTGVVFGPPPFAVNDLSEYDIHEVSNVEYGYDDSGTVSHKQTWENSMMFSSGTQVGCGLGKKASVKDEFDISYKHAWEHTHQDSTTQEMGFDDTFGTKDESPGGWGTHGWAVFTCPTLVTQNFDIYAYDYNVNTGAGSYLGQSLCTISTGQMAVRAFGFMLGDPGGAGDDVPGLLSGLPAFPSSMDLEAWEEMTWEKQGAPWQVVAGTGQSGGVMAPQVSQGTFTQQHFSQTTKTVDSKGQTTDIEIGDTLTLQTKLGIFGIKETLKAGYDSHYSTETETETEISTKVGYELHLPYLGTGCTEPDCVKKLTVQPFLLKATDYTAPWVPPGYDHQLPWCMTWQVTDYETADGTRSGMSPPPAQSEGTIVGGDGPGRAEGAEEADSPRWSSLRIEGGVLAWMEPDGTLTPVPLTADSFDAPLGAVVIVNGHAVTTDPSRGKWHRNGQVWKYQTKDAITRDKVLLKLDFKAQTWTFEIKKVDLYDPFPASDGHARVTLALQGRYVLRCDIPYRVSTTWEFEAPAVLPEELEVTRYSGSYHPGTGEGKLVLEGDLPVDLGSFGDVSFTVNGRRCDIPLLSLKDFDKAVERGRDLTYKAHGVKFTVHFGKGTWKARLDGGAFDPLMVPRWGGGRLRVEVGGVPWHSAERPVRKYTTKLKYPN